MKKNNGRAILWITLGGIAAVVIIMLFPKTSNETKDFQRVGNIAVFNFVEEALRCGGGFIQLTDKTAKFVSPLDAKGGMAGGLGYLEMGQDDLMEHWNHYDLRLTRRRVTPPKGPSYLEYTYAHE